MHRSTLKEGEFDIAINANDKYRPITALLLMRPRRYVFPELFLVKKT